MNSPNLIGQAIFLNENVSAIEPAADNARSRFKKLNDGDFFSLWAFLALGYSELNLLPFIQRFVAGSNNIAEVNENIGATFLLNEAKTFFCVKPFHGSCSHSFFLSIVLVIMPFGAGE